MVLSLTQEGDGKESQYAELVAKELGVPALDVKVVPPPRGAGTPRRLRSGARPAARAGRAARVGGPACRRPPRPGAGTGGTRRSARPRRRRRQSWGRRGTGRGPPSA